MRRGRIGAIALRAPSPLGLRPEPLRVSAIRRVSTIAGALLLAACGDAVFEADPIQYHTVAGYAELDFGHASELARETLADGYLSNAEYVLVIEAADEQYEAEYRLTRDRIIAGSAR